MKIWKPELYFGGWKFFFLFVLGIVKLSWERAVIHKQCTVCTLIMVKVVKILSGSHGGKGQQKKRDINLIKSVKNKGRPHEC